MSKKWSKLFLLTACTTGAYALYQYYKKQNANSIIDENSEGGKNRKLKSYIKNYQRRINQKHHNRSRQGIFA